MPIPKIVTQYEYEKFEKPGVDFAASDKNSKSKTMQSDMDAADINKIMSRFEKTGVIIDPNGVERQPVYGDFTGITDYHGMLTAVRNAERVFGLYPATIRNRFDNDPQKFITFMEDIKNDPEAVKLGLKDSRTAYSALADDGVTQITGDERRRLDKIKIENPVAVTPPATPTA